MTRTAAGPGRLGGGPQGRRLTFLPRGVLLRHNVGGVIGGAVLAIVVLCAVFAPLIAPHDPLAQSLADVGRPPAWMSGGDWNHVLGTDQLGRDLLSRVIYGARISMIVGLGTVVLQTVLGVLAGLYAGYFGGWLDSLLMRFADVWLSIPFLVLALAVMAVLGAGLTNTVLVLGLTGWVTYARVVRGEVLSVREREYVLAAESLGERPVRSMVTHVLPNVTGSIIVVATLQVSHMIIIEASLSFLGLGVQPPQPSWGSMIAQGRDYLYNQWWLSTMPGLALLVTTLGINLLGDSLRDVLDPSLRGRS
ncbi:MAG: ABC transporter permease subunit [Streptosporangiales bacterium]|nr:ABC transporter permease subunit [Streptosporangiales bacterium]